MFSFLIGTVYSLLTQGLALFCYWRWFVNTAFEGAPELSFLSAVGLSFLISLFHSTDLASLSVIQELGETEGKSTEEMIKGLGTLIGVIAQPWVLLLIGYLIYTLLIK